METIKRWLREDMGRFVGNPLSFLWNFGVSMLAAYAILHLLGLQP